MGPLTSFLLSQPSEESVAPLASKLAEKALTPAEINRLAEDLVAEWQTNPELKARSLALVGKGPKEAVSHRDLEVMVRLLHATHSKNASVEYHGKTFPGYNQPIKSDSADKKMMVLAKKGDEVKLIHFGQKGYQHNYSPEAKQNYLTRSAGIRDKSGNLTKDDPFSPNYWARKVLWPKGETGHGHNGPVNTEVRVHSEKKASLVAFLEKRAAGTASSDSLRKGMADPDLYDGVSMNKKAGRPIQTILHKMGPTGKSTKRWWFLSKRGHPTHPKRFLDRPADARPADGDIYRPWNMAESHLHSKNGKDGIHFFGTLSDARAELRKAKRGMSTLKVAAMQDDFYEGMMDGEKKASLAAFLEKRAAELSDAAREKIPAREFAVSKRLAKKSGDEVRAGEEGKYPIPDRAHARNALARVAQHGTPAEVAAVKAKVKKAFPDIDVDGEKKASLFEVMAARKENEKWAAAAKLAADDNFGHGAELAGLGILAVPAAASIIGKKFKMPGLHRFGESDAVKHSTELVGLGTLAAPSVSHFLKKKPTTPGQQ